LNPDFCAAVEADPTVAGMLLYEIGCATTG